MVEAVRARLHRLVDPGSVVELARLARSQQPAAEHETPGDGLITCWARMDGRDVAVLVEDGPTLQRTDAQVAENKRNRLLALAISRSIPVVYLADGPLEAPRPFPPLEGRLYGHLAQAVGTPLLSELAAPVIFGLLGPCTGRTAVMASAADVVIAGPGGDGSGVAADVQAASEGELLSAIHRLMSTLSRSWAEASLAPLGDVPAERAFTESTSPDVSAAKLIDGLADRGSVIALGGRGSVVKTLAEIGGIPTLIVVCAGSAVTLPDLCEIRRATRLSRRLGLPILIVQDIPGYDPVEREQARFVEVLGEIEEDLRLTWAPKLSLIAGQGQALGTFVLGGRQLGFDYLAAWPWAEVAVGPEDGDAGSSGTDPISPGPWLAAGMGIVDDVLAPEETRERVATLLRILARSRDVPPPEVDRRGRLVADISKV